MITGRSASRSNAAARATNAGSAPVHVHGSTAGADSEGAVADMNT
jgi:hypothetical protein